jgi:hypothetical protein
MSVQAANKFGANDAVYHYHSIVDGEGFRFASLEGVAPIDLVGPEPRLVMIQRNVESVGKAHGPARNDAIYQALNFG